MWLLPLSQMTVRLLPLSQMSCSGLEEDDFRRCCRLLLQRSEQLRDGWSWEGVQGSEEGYLRKTALRSGSGSDSVPPASSHSREEEEEEEESGLGASGDIAEDEEDDEDDGVCVASGGSSQVLQYEYHILHSCSYATPVLYFRASTQGGRSLSLEEVWSSVHPNFRLRLQSSPLNTITLQEHPLLGQPFFMLHPCRTEEFMRPVLQAAREQRRPVNYVLSWLSAVGPVVGLDVPLEYCTEPG
ncbi:ubiquitin-like-conjugating enzyme ATG10 [Pseudoliparis swirei]|uniref:ubiquitin-like-conjugating enzyme ATG10 n=1 Tax=Pseudoliparis swirei TaxID=2059687 RepID=UPI0024BD5FCA|nr:ubiquitin-like-conjugating enzyme ATG10 [Pseudoliparis swirei]